LIAGPKNLLFANSFKIFRHTEIFQHKKQLKIPYFSELSLPKQKNATEERGVSKERSLQEEFIAGQKALQFRFRSATQTVSCFFYEIGFFVNRSSVI
jgi:hypothetical protein